MLTPLHSNSFQLCQIIKKIEFIEKQVQGSDYEIKAYMNKLCSPITAFPGVGPVYGAMVLPKVGHISHFSSRKQLVSYAWIDANVKESGEFKGKRHMSPYMPHLT